MEALDNATAPKTAFTHRQHRDGQDSGVFDFLSLIAAWPNIVGQNLSQHTIPLKNVRGTLTILSRHSAFSQQLALLEQVLLEKILNQFPSGIGKIKKLQFITNTAHFDQQRASLENQTPDQLHPQSPVFKKKQMKAVTLFDDVSDPQLRQQLISLYVQSTDNSQAD